MDPPRIKLDTDNLYQLWWWRLGFHYICPYQNNWGIQIQTEKLWSPLLSSMQQGRWQVLSHKLSTL